MNSMMFRKFLSKFLLFGSVLLMSACSGGGGSSSKDSDKVPDSGEQPESTVSLTIQGYVETASYTGVEVKFHVDESYFHGLVDAFGNYSINIEVDESRIHSFVKGEAIFPSESGIRLVSLLGSVESLIEKAGEDQILVRSELLDVNITSLSTALSAVLEINNNGPVQSRSQFDLAYHSMEASVVFAIATYVKILIDNPLPLEEAGIGLPEEAADTYELATNYSLASLYVARVSENFPDLFEETKKNISRDLNLLASSPSEHSPIADTYYLPSMGMRLVLREDGTGEVNGVMDYAAITWLQTNDGILLDGADLIESTYYDEFNSAYEETHLTINKINWLSENSIADSIVIEVMEYTHYPDGQYQDQDFIDRTNMNFAIRSSGVIPVSGAIELSKLYSLPVVTTPGEIIDPIVEISPQHIVRALDMKFHGDYGNGGSVDITIPEVRGNGELSEISLSGLWYLEDSHQLVVEMPSGIKLTYMFLGYRNRNLPWVFLLEESDEGKRVKFYTDFVQDSTGWEEVEVEGIYLASDPMQNFWWPSDYYWFELNADGMVEVVSVFDSNFSGSLEDDEVNTYPGLWKLNDNNNVTIRHYWKREGGYCVPDSWNPASMEDCHLYREREWEIYNINESSKFRMKKKVQNFDDYQRELIPNISDIDGHLLRSSLIYHSEMKKIAERPVKIPKK